MDRLLRIGLSLLTVLFVANVIAGESAKFAGIGGKVLLVVRLASLAADWTVLGIPVGLLALLIVAAVFCPTSCLLAAKAAAKVKNRLAPANQVHSDHLG